MLTTSAERGPCALETHRNKDNEAHKHMDNGDSTANAVMFNSHADYP